MTLKVTLAVTPSWLCSDFALSKTVFSCADVCSPVECTVEPVRLTPAGSSPSAISNVTGSSAVNEMFAEDAFSVMKLNDCDVKLILAVL